MMWNFCEIPNSNLWYGVEYGVCRRSLKYTLTKKKYGSACTLIEIEPYEQNVWQILNERALL